MGAAVALALAALIDVAAGKVVILALAARLFMAQGFNSAYWVEFFSSHPKTHYGNSTLGGFFSYPYDGPPGFVVGQWLGRPDVNVNANLMADGYAAVGLLGVAISALVFSLTLETIRALSPAWMSGWSRSRWQDRCSRCSTRRPSRPCGEAVVLLAIAFLLVCPRELSDTRGQPVRSAERT